MEKRRESLIKAFQEVGKAMILFANQSGYDSFNKLMDESLYDRMMTEIETAHRYNGWFTPESVRNALLELGQLLTEEKLSNWTKEYEFSTSPKSVGIVMAGNIPLVGFHDFLCVIFSGNKAIVKLSSDDNRIFPILLEIITLYYPEIFSYVNIQPQLKEIDAVIATGSDNSARYFEKYFERVPHIIRRNRTSLAVLNGTETKEELYQLGKDIFMYFGLGCRNVSKIFIPQDFDLNRLFEAILPYNEIIHHHKYANNYDYYKAVYLMNKHQIIENGFLLTMESEELFAPIGVLLITRYNHQDEVEQYLDEHKSQIQVIVGKDYIPFGEAQSPRLNDYADGVNTMQFLDQINKK